LAKKGIPDLRPSLKRIPEERREFGCSRNRFIPGFVHWAAVHKSHHWRISAAHETSADHETFHWK
jgi:hypothetical protein